MSGGRLTRRRFLAISAASVAAGPAMAGAGRTVRWRGEALGATVEISLRGSDREADRGLHGAKSALRRIERLFSLYDPDSALSRLNQTGRLQNPAPAFLDLLRLSDRLHAATGGLFDPSVQPLWRLMARTDGAPDQAALDDAMARVGWSGVVIDPHAVRLARSGMALTFNGIAQGFATDRVSEALAEVGFADTLVNVGEFRAGDGSWRIGVEDPSFGLIATRRLDRMAVATSSPAALSFGRSGFGHILHPAGPRSEPRWSTVSVEAKSAAIADGASTAFCFLDAGEIAAARAAIPGISRVLLVGSDGMSLEVT